MTREINKHQKSYYWRNVALPMRPAFRVLIAAGILEKGPNSFRNVAKHSLLQVGIHEVLGKLLSSTSEEIKTHKSTAMVHDADKRHQKKKDIPESRWSKYLDLRRDLQVDEKFIHAQSGIENHKSILIDGQIPSWQAQIAWYVDNIAGKSEVIHKGINILVEDIVTIDNRIDELKTRNPDHGKDTPVEIVKKMEATLEKEYGWDKPYKYWEVERMFMKRVETSIFNKLKENGVQIEKPEDIPSYIKSLIEKEYVK